MLEQYFDNVELLLHLNGSNGSTTFTDSSSNGLTVTRGGNVTISTAQAKFGGASAVFDGSGDYPTANNAALALAMSATGPLSVGLGWRHCHQPAGGFFSMAIPPVMIIVSR